MIHQLLNLTRPLFVVDTETTGTEPQKDRIIEIGFEQWTAEGMIKEWRTLIQPGVPIPEEAYGVHGISDTTLQRCSKCDSLPGLMHQPEDGHEFDPWPTFKYLAASLAKGFSNCDFAGKNVRFDLRIIGAEMQRAGVAWSYLGARVIDAERLEQLAVPRSLSHLHEKYTGRKHDGAHGALSDVRASTTVIVHQLQQYDTLPRDIDALHLAQWPDEWLDGEGKFRKIKGTPTCMFGKYRGKPMQGIDLGYWDWLLKQDFPEDVKQLARNAKLGIFP